MNVERDWKVIGVSVLIFGVCLSVLTGLRVWDLEPSTSVQSLIVDGTVLLVLAATAVRVYRGGDFIGSWILVFGPSLAFTLNLIIPIHRGGLLTLIGYPLVTAVLLSSVLASLGFSAGYAVRAVQNGLN